MIDENTYQAYKTIDQKSMVFLFYYTLLKRELEEKGEIITKREKEEIVKRFLPFCHFSV